MTEWRELELHYAKILKSSVPRERRRLFEEAYTAVSAARMATMPDEPECRAAGTSDALVKSLLRFCQPQDDILEIGCGRGYTCAGLASHVNSITGIDVSAPVLDEARALLENRGITNAKIAKGFADELTSNFPEQSFDKIVSIDVYEHLHPDDVHRHLEQVHAVLRPGGEAIIVTPNRHTGPHDMTRDLFPDAREPLGFHLNETTYDDLSSKLKGVGFSRIRAVLPLSFYSPVKNNLVFPAVLSAWAESWHKLASGIPIVDKIERVLIDRVYVVARRA
jgi:SAM-dependent methyltransferase